MSAVDLQKQKEQVLRSIDHAFTMISSLRKDDLIVVEWNDACGFRNIRRITRAAYVTNAKNSGFYYGTYEGHMVIISQFTDFTGNLTYEGNAIPVGCIAEITVKPSPHKPHKVPKKVIKEVKKVIRQSQGLPVKIITLYVKIPTS